MICIMKIVRVLFRGFVMIMVIILLNLFIENRLFYRLDPETRARLMTLGPKIDEAQQDIYDYISTEIVPNMPVLLENASHLPSPTSNLNSNPQSGFKPSDAFAGLVNTEFADFLPFRN